MLHWVAMKNPARRRLPCLAAALAGFLAQGILPAAHAWRVAVEEAACHAAFPAALGRAALSPDRSVPHDHHDAAACSCCFLSLRSGGAFPVAAAAPAVPAAADPLSPGLPGAARAAELLHPAGRGPPASS